MAEMENEGILSWECVEEVCSNFSELVNEKWELGETLREGTHAECLIDDGLVGLS